MKPTASQVLPALLLAFSLCGSFSQAADVFGPPATVDYQGRVLDSDGAILAPNTPTNYEMRFRLYDAQSGGTVIWAEKQIVTVSKGQFSVRLGEGTALLNTVGGGNEGTVDHDTVGLPEAFNGKERYLGVTVVIPGQTSGEIQPRLSFLTSPYSYVSGKADVALRISQAAGSQPSNLSVGAISYVPVTVSTSGQLGGTNSSILADATTGTLAATLPALAEKKEMVITKTDTSTNPVTVSPPAGGTINGSTASLSLTSRGDSVTLRNVTGNEWWIVSRIGTADTSIFLNKAPLRLLNSTDYTTNNPLPTTAPNGPYLSYRSTFAGTSLSEILTNGSNLRVPNTAPQGLALISNAGGVLGTSYNGVEKIAIHWVRAPNPNFQLQNDQNFGSMVGINGPAREGSTVAIYSNINSGGGFAFYSNFNNNGGSVGTLTFNNFNNNNSTFFGNPGGPFSLSCDGIVGAGIYYAFSDERIKNIHGVSDSHADMETLMALKVTNYTYRDTIAKGSRPQKKLIAQQVEKVYPLAVSQGTDVVPDVMKKATVDNGWVDLATDLKVGERVRLLTEKDQGKIYEVLEVAAGKFRTALPASEKLVFVYGREVKDFRSVDYEAIAMLNVSATQEIKKESDQAEAALRKENEELRAKLAAQEKRLAAAEAVNATFESRLAALEAASAKKEVRTAATTAQPAATVFVSTK